MATKKWKIEVQNSLNPWGSVHIFNDQNCTIATVFNTPPWEEVNGNAQMIAKAPDMLAMLRELLESDDALLQSDLYSRVE